MKCNFFRIKLSSWRWIIVLSLMFLPSAAEAVKVQMFNWSTSGDSVQYVLGTGRTSGNIWGSGVYTNDSDIWTAAVHAGVLSSGQVGVIKVTVLPGQSSYQGSTKNGVTTASYGSWSGSFSVSSWIYNGEPIDDPTNLFYWRGMSGTYNFSLVGTSNGGVWGTDAYTDDSLLAKAAVHAGKLAVGQSGVVAVTLAPGLSSYVGSTRNGVSTSSFGSFGGSYNFGAVSTTYTISTAASPAAGGSVTCSPNPVSSGSSTCTATANSGYTFASWSGDCSGTTSTCMLSNVTAQKSVTAVFKLLATPTASTIFDNFNTGGVSSGPSAATVFSVSSSVKITNIMTYHYNGGSGSTPGTISLKHFDGTVYGPWTATGYSDPKYFKLYWNVYPETVIKPGSYTVIDSGTATWSYNSTSGNAGFVLVKGDVVTTSNYTISTAASPAAGGTITSTPAGIDCGSTCSASLSGTVTLTATPADNNTYFFGWSGACSGIGSCVVTMDAAKNVTAIFKPKPFVATTTSTITPTSATISTTVSFVPADAGKTGAVYITAWAPSNGLGALGIILSAPMNQAMSVTVTNGNPYTGGKINTRQETLGAILAAADPNAFVLVQLTSSGWQLVQNGQLIPYATGVLGDSMVALNILNNANPANLLGAQFCVGYGTSAAEMVASGRMMPVVAIPGATAATNGSCNVAANPYKGLWWNPAESGWGMSVTQHDNINFVALYTYDQSAQPVWYVMSNCPIVTAGRCTGDIYKVTGGKPPTTSWVALDFAQALSTVGSGTLTFSDANHGTFDFTLNGVAGSKTIERQQFSSGTAAQAVDYTDLWWNAGESGWGVALTQDVGMIFAAWYTYDAAGLPVWYVASSCPLSGSGCTGDIYKVTGGTVPTSPWAPNLAVNKVGTVTFVFSDSGTGTMSYTIDGVAGTRKIVRQAF